MWHHCIKMCSGAGRVFLWGRGQAVALTIIVASVRVWTSEKLGVRGPGYQKKPHQFWPICKLLLMVICYSFLDFLFLFRLFSGFFPLFPSLFLFSFFLKVIGGSCPLSHPLAPARPWMCCRYQQAIGSINQRSECWLAMRPGQPKKSPNNQKYRSRYSMDNHKSATKTHLLYLCIFSK